MSVATLTLYRYTWLLVLVIAGAFYGITHFSTPNLIAYDGHFHIKWAYLMRTEGLFVQRNVLPLTILKGEFLDHHFLYHVLLMPFTFLDLRVAGKLAPVVFSTLMVLTFFTVVRREKIPWPFFWVLLLLASSSFFHFRMSMARVMHVALIFQLGTFLLLIEKRHRTLFIVAFAYAWLHPTASFVVPMMAGFYLLSKLLLEEKEKATPLVYSIAGWVAGHVVNPFFPENLVFAYKANMHKLFFNSIAKVGTEWYSFHSSHLVKTSLLAFVVLLFGILMMGLSKRRIRCDTLFAFFLMVIYAVGIMKARRFVEYWLPFTVLFCAFSARDFFSFDENRSFVQQLHKYKKLLISLLTITVGASLFWVGLQVQDKLSNSVEINRFRPAALWLGEHTKKDEPIFNNKWYHLPELFFHNSDLSFVSGMDPAFMEMEDHNRYLKFKEITAGEVSNPSELISSLFKSRFIFTKNSSEDFIESLSKDERIRKVYSDEVCSIFEVIGGEG